MKKTLKCETSTEVPNFDAIKNITPVEDQKGHYIDLLCLSHWRQLTDIGLKMKALFAIYSKIRTDIGKTVGTFDQWLARTALGWENERDAAMSVPSNFSLDKKELALFMGDNSDCSPLMQAAGRYIYGATTTHSKNKKEHKLRFEQYGKIESLAVAGLAEAIKNVSKPKNKVAVA